MPEYIEREAVLALETFMQDADGFDTFCVLSADIRRLPAADVVAVVRCKDCKNHKPTSVKEYEHCALLGYTVEETDFCSFGERRADNATD